MGMGMLGVTFRGPFAFSIQPMCVDVFLPLCDNHFAWAFTANSEMPLCGRARMGGEYIYLLEGDGIVNNLDDITFSSGGQTLILSAPSNCSIDASQAKLRVTVPRPNSVFGINKTTTEIVKDKPTGKLQEYATGLRFYYECDLSEDIYMRTPEGNRPELLLNDLPSLPVYGDIDIQYAGPDVEDAEHLDAIACFDKTMTMINLPWWLNYGQSGPSVETRRGSDCRSAIIVLGAS
jgi:hypothetical protein